MNTIVIIPVIGRRGSVNEEPDGIQRSRRGTIRLVGCAWVHMVRQYMHDEKELRAEMGADTQEIAV